jgi:hypothetical protein
MACRGGSAAKARRPREALHALGGGGFQPDAPSWVDAARPRRLDSQCMATLEYVLNIAPVGLVVLQVRGIKLTAMFRPWV